VTIVIKNFLLPDDTCMNSNSKIPQINAIIDKLSEKTQMKFPEIHQITTKLSEKTEFIVTTKLGKKSI